MKQNSNGFNEVRLSGLSAMNKNQTVTSEPGAQQHLTFYIGDELFALAVDVIREVIEYGRLTDVPMIPAFIRGVTNLRGSVIPVIDLSLRFGRAATEEGKRTCIVIVEVPHEAQLLIVGVMVDAVNSVVAVEQHHIEASPSFGANLRADFIQAMLNIDDRFIIALEIGNVLSVDEIVDLVGLSVNEGSMVFAKE